MKKWTGFIVCLLLAVIVAGCGSNSNNAGNSAASPSADASNGGTADNGSGEKKRIALVTPEKIGVNQFFTQMEDAMAEASEEFGFDYQIVESTDPTQFEQNLRAVVAEKYDLIITAAYTAADALTKVAAENPDQPFAIIDTVVDAPNVRSIEFREYEAAYLLGALAGLSTKTDTVGAIVAMDTPLLSKYTSGFDQGLKSVNPDAKFLINYVGSFTDPAKAKEMAILQNSQGADFVAGMSAVGDSGVFEAAKEKGFYTSGQDTDRTVEDPEHIVLSQLKETDTVTYETVKDFMEGNFTYGSTSYGLAENGVGITFVTAETESPLSDFVGQENVDKVKQIRDDIVSGKIEVKNPLAE